MASVNEIRDANFRAQDFIEQAEAKLKKSLFHKPKFPEGLELYNKAVAQLKISGDYGKCATVYQTMAKIYEVDLNNKSKALSHYKEAASCLARDKQSAEAIKLYELVAGTANDNGDLTTAAQAYEAIAFIHEEANPPDLESCLKAYSTAVDLYTASNHPMRGENLSEKIIIFNMRIGNYKEAIEVLEKLAKTSLIKDGPESNRKVAKLYFRAFICHLVIALEEGRVGSLRGVLQKYRPNRALSECYEAELSDRMLAAVESENVADYAQALFDANKTVSLQGLDGAYGQYTKQTLLRIRRALENKKQAGPALNDLLGGGSASGDSGGDGGAAANLQGLNLC